mmetsp:Transcript_43279/g.104618  ORF Transcript_43279/g.104618 Transcript_43279/m.104618 type:complete len:83 (-) Transcript_43279:354-602(-)
MDFLRLVVRCCKQMVCGQLNKLEEHHKPTKKSDDFGRMKTSADRKEGKNLHWNKSTGQGDWRHTARPFVNLLPTFDTLGGKV